MKDLLQRQKLFVGFFSTALLLLLTFGITTTRATQPTPITNLTSTSGSTFVRLDWEDTGTTTTDYKIKTRQSSLPLTGSVDPDGTSAVSGVGTLFTSELSSGETIIVSGEERMIFSIASDTLLYVWGTFPDVAPDTTPEKHTAWSVYDDGVSLETQTIVTDLSNDTQYQFSVAAVLPPDPNAKNPNANITTSAAVTTQTPFFEGYDIVILAGQSNMVGASLADLDGDISPHDETWRIKQWGRHNGNDNTIIDAGDPLDHHTTTSSNGLGMTFARDYRDTQLDDNRELLLLPAAYSGTGFTDELGSGNDWSVGESLSTDLIARANLAYATDPDNEFVALLWNQGENEVIYISGGATSEGVTIDQQWYETEWLAMINEYESQITGFDSTVPVVLARMSEPWITMSDGSGAIIDAAHQNIPNLRANTATVDSLSPSVLTIWDYAHYDETSLVELGHRYYTEFVQL